MFIIEKRNIFFSLSALLVAASLFVIFAWGLPLGIDFRGGSLVEVEYVDTRPDLTTLSEKVNELDFGEGRVQATGDTGVIVRLPALSEEGHAQVIGELREEGELTEKRFTLIGPIIGEELKEKARWAISLTIILIILFIAYTFRKVSHPVKSWKYGVVAIVALAHDILIPTGFLVALSRVTGSEVDILFVTALLATLGLSVNDTIVVFDRIRENLKNKTSRHFPEVVGVSLSQTISRSINTSLTTLVVLFALFFLGPESTREFALVLSVGLIAGTYSSIFLASPLLVELQKRQKRP